METCGFPSHPLAFLDSRSPFLFMERRGGGEGRGASRGRPGLHPHFVQPGLGPLPEDWMRGFPHEHQHPGFHRGGGLHRSRGARGGRGGRGGRMGAPFADPRTIHLGDMIDPWSQFEAERRQSDSGHVDFTPLADVFSTPTEYVVHVSLPGANKEDISVEFNSDRPALHISGVVHRPGFSEELNRSMTVEERSREVGAFKREIELGTHEYPASVDAENMSAKFVNGVLVVRLPKSQTTSIQKKIYIETDDANVETASESLSSDVNEKHASVIEVPDESESMHVDSETENGELLQETEDPSSYTPIHDSEEEDLYNIVKSNDNIRVNIE